MTGWGGFSEHIVVDAFKLVNMPTGIDFPAASGVMMTYGTSYHALKQRANLQPGETGAYLLCNRVNIKICFSASSRCCGWSWACSSGACESDGEWKFLQLGHM